MAVRAVERFPAVELLPELMTSMQAAAGVADGRLDAAFVINPVKNAEVVAIPIWKESIGLWGKGEGTLFYNPDMYRMEAYIKKLRPHRRTPIRDYEVVARMVQTGVGRGILPNTVAERYKLGEARETYTQLQLSALYHRERMRQTARLDVLRSLVEAVRESRPIRTGA